ncbi:MAG: cytoplasmic protein [Candidatus Tectomicrobia bacterium]|uniref:Cytoplasmic protein n=1 Tax=Tectimicrobiota bacterium TaxID=2528274 RepID=A0A938B4D1_UNCTE|nr:cytoplasmic protein [Candidatus Tectomicrobia bacterium]
MAEAQRQYGTFEASELFCQRCRQSRPVRKHLLLVLPTGNKYDYRCAVCATSVGSKMDENSSDFQTLMTGAPPRP